MKKVSLSGSPRENVGKKDAKLGRKEGMVPCVIYGGKEQVHFSAKKLDIDRMVFTADVFLVELDVNGSKKNAIIQDIQIHPVTDNVLHVDFLEVMDDREIKVSLPIRLLGGAIGVRNGGRPAAPLRTLAVKGLAKDLPNAIELNIEEVKIGDKLRVGDLEYPNLNILVADDAVLFAVKMSRGAIEDEEAEAAAALEAAEGEEGAEKPAEGGDAKAETAEKPAKG